MRSLIAGAVLASGMALGVRFDHHGALGVTVAAGGEYVTAIGAVSGIENGVRIPIELGATLSVSNHNELRLAARLSPGIVLSTLSTSFYAGVRNTLGYEQWKTFFDLELAVHATPFVAIGARAAFGVQYDFLPIMGVYAQLGGQLGGATSLRLSFEVMAGLQFRTYLFE